MNRTKLAEWKLTDRVEPTVRVGLVLESDDRRRQRIQFSSMASVSFDGRESSPLSPGEVEFVLDHGRVTLSGGVEGDHEGEVVRLRVADRSDDDQPSDTAVRDLIAGRGFHWQKHQDQILAGDFEFRAAERGLVLINEVGLEDYLAGVITAEMSAACPVEFLKAQCVVARSWLLARGDATHDGDPFDRCNDDCCQRYQGNSERSESALAAVSKTRGQVLLASNGQVVDANYSKSCGGVSELPEHVWGVQKPGLSAIVDMPRESARKWNQLVDESNLSEFITGHWTRDTDAYCGPNTVTQADMRSYLGRVDEIDDYFRWRIGYDAPTLANVVRTKVKGADSLRRVRDIRAISRGVSGRISRLELDFECQSGESHTVSLDNELAIRFGMHQSCLYSSAFVMTIDRDDDGYICALTLDGAGWGHGAGLCQIGALGMALKGFSCEKILKHYFPQASTACVY